MLRIHLTEADVARTRLAGVPDPAWEVPLSRRILHSEHAAPVFGAWRSQVRRAPSLDSYFDVALAPHWHTICAHVAVEHRVRAGKPFSVTHPALRWTPLGLDVVGPAEQDVRLDGRGLTLAPSFFCWGAPVYFMELRVLAFPIDHAPGWADNSAAEPSEQSLTTLLGRTRAAVLGAIRAQPHITTTELARRLGISAAGASQHAAVLRESGLITTVRLAGVAIHALAPRGRALLGQPRLCTTIVHSLAAGETTPFHHSVTHA
ncbi:DNA-binding transcriptional regulator, ArsR family [Lentzea xinjiangensis]|uniref:DNA-binding transcriptional regulator, ArsR family n=1 Tax=Lentzea xinjiangensis TaxID=402600 RepID=A0A1H9F6U2_9PSEU|nr:winged helix-turn-helix domain-containing protein [Lentzea xinjiangensis]SEQ33153.1 DNA-binding transcriptional regulator, ArsR family [Lentzea xinjiangensis]